MQVNPKVSWSWSFVEGSLEDPFPIKLIISHPEDVGKAEWSQKSQREGSCELSIHLLFSSRGAFNTSEFLSPGMFLKAFPTTCIPGMHLWVKELEKWSLEMELGGMSSVFWALFSTLCQLCSLSCPSAKLGTQKTWLTCLLGLIKATTYEPTSLQTNHLSPLPCAQLGPHKNASTDFRASRERHPLQRCKGITWKPSIRAHLSSPTEMGDSSHCCTTTLLTEEGKRWSKAVLILCAHDLLNCLMQIPSLTAAPSPEERCGISPHILVLQLSLSFFFLWRRNCTLQLKRGDVCGEPTGCWWPLMSCPLV